MHCRLVSPSKRGLKIEAFSNWKQGEYRFQIIAPFSIQHQACGLLGLFLQQLPPTPHSSIKLAASLGSLGDCKLLPPTPEGLSALCPLHPAAWYMSQCSLPATPPQPSLLLHANAVTCRKELVPHGEATRSAHGGCL